ncbi:sugar ABC transporter permease [Paenibacillus sp. MY03]|jgi:putative aldouronate transport system permease protein|nr:sugar ABC transporter permease [Paenibacillus sp. MY03]
MVRERRYSVNKNIGWSDVVILLFMFVVVVITLYPFLYMTAVSFSSPSYIARGEVYLWPKGFTLDMYSYVFEDGRILNGYRNTLLYVTLGTMVSLTITAVGAYPLSKRSMVFNRPTMLFIIFTMFFSGGMIPTFLVVKELGLVNTIWAMVIPGAVSTWNLIIMRTFFQGFPTEIEESAKLDGLNDFGVFWRMCLPLSKPVLATVGLFYAVFIWNNYMTPLIYLRNSDLYPLQVILRNIVLAGQMMNNEGYSGGSYSISEEALKYATIMVSTLPILCVYPFLQKYFVKGALIGSVKG